MGYTKPKETTKHFLSTSPLPNHGSTYTVIPHREVMKHTEALLAKNGFIIERELYRANVNAQVAQGIYHIKPVPELFNLMSTSVKEETEMQMMFAWTNSYDKSTRFQCAIGGYVLCCSNGLVCGDMATFARKHTGSADQEVSSQISSQIKSAHKFFKRLVSDKAGMNNIVLSLQQQAELLGRLFFEKKLLNVEQLSCVRSELNEASFDYNADKDNAWVFYNHVTHALKKTHPRTWLSDQQKFHEFMVADVLGKLGINQKDSSDPQDPALQSPTDHLLSEDDEETYSEQEAKIQESAKEHIANDQFHDIRSDEALKADVMEENVINETDSGTLPSELHGPSGENQDAHRVHTSGADFDVDKTDSELSSPKDVEIDVEDDDGSFIM